MSRRVREVKVLLKRSTVGSSMVHFFVFVSYKISLVIDPAGFGFEDTLGTLRAGTEVSLPYQFTSLDFFNAISPNTSSQSTSGASNLKIER